MSKNLLCIDWFMENEEGVSEHQKDWLTLSSSLCVVDIYDVRLRSVVFSDVLLVIVHDSIKSKSPSNWRQLEEKLRTSRLRPFVMFVSTQPSVPSQSVKEEGRWNTTAVPFPKPLAHLHTGFEKLVNSLAEMERSSDAPEIVQLRIQAWEEWEKSCRLTSKPILSTISLLCQGYLAAHGGVGLDGWTADHQRRVTANAQDLTRKAWWIEDVFESPSALQHALLSELNVQTIEEIPDGIRDLVREISSGDENPIERAIVQSAFETLRSIQGVR